MAFDFEKKITDGELLLLTDRSNSRCIIRTDSGVVYAFVEDDNPGTVRRWLAKSVDDGVNWTFPVQVPWWNSGTARSARIAYNSAAGANTVHLALSLEFSENPSHVTELVYRQVVSDVLGGYEYPFDLTGAINYHDAPRIVIDSSGDVYLAAIVASSGAHTYTLQIKKRTGFNSFTTVYDSDVTDGWGFGVPAASSWDFLLADDGDGDIHFIASFASGVGWKHIWYNGLTWQKETAPTPTTSAVLGFVADSSGNLYFSGSSNSVSTGTDVYIAEKPAAGAWGAFGSLCEGSFANLTIDSSDDVHVVHLGNSTDGADQGKIFLISKVSGSWGSRQKMSEKTPDHLSSIKHATSQLELVSEDSDEVWYHRGALISGPYVLNQNPVADSQDNSPSTNMYFELKDDDDNINLNSVDIWVDFDDGSGWTQIYNNGAIVPGYSVVRAELTPGTHYSYTFDPTPDFGQAKKIQVKVYAEDVAAHSTTTEWLFYTELPGGVDVLILNESPVNYANQVDVTDSIEFDIISNNDDIDQSTITLTVTQRSFLGVETVYNVITAGWTILAGWSVTAGKTSMGYHIEATKVGSLSEQCQYLCNAYGEDSSANNDRSVWVFWTDWNDGYNHDIYVDSEFGDDSNSGIDWDHSVATIEMAISRWHPGRTIHIASGYGYVIPDWYRGYTGSPGRGWLIEGFHSGPDSAHPSRIITKEDDNVVLWVPHGESDRCAFEFWCTRNIEVQAQGSGRFYLWSNSWGLEIRNSQNITIDKFYVDVRFGGGGLLRVYSDSDPQGIDCADITFNRICSVGQSACGGGLGSIHYYLITATDELATSVYHATIVNGRAFWSGPGGDTGSPAILANSIFFGDITRYPDTIRAGYTNNVDYPGATNLGANTLHADPLFFGHEAWDYRLRPDSPYVDAGVHFPGINDWYVGSAPDRGAYEMRRVGSGVSADLYIDNVDGDDSNSGTSWVNALKTFDMALYKGEPGVTFHVKGSDTRYTEPVTTGRYYDSILADPTQFVADHPSGDMPIISGQVAIRSNYTTMNRFGLIRLMETVLVSAGVYVMAPAISIFECEGSIAEYCIAFHSGPSASFYISGYDTGYMLGAALNASSPQICGEAPLTRGVVDCRIQKCLGYGMQYGLMFCAQIAASGNKIYNVTLNSFEEKGLVLFAQDVAGMKVDVKNCSLTQFAYPGGECMMVWTVFDPWVLGVDYDSDYNNVYNYAGSNYQPTAAIDGPNSLNKPTGINPLYIGGDLCLIDNTSSNWDAGVDVGLPYYNAAPDIGWYEYQYIPPTPGGWNDFVQWWAHIF